MRAVRHRLGFCLWLWASACTAGGYYTGTDLAQWKADFDKAQRQDKSVDFASAWQFRAYVLGVHDALEGTAFCPSQAVPDIQIAAVVARYLELHPDQWHLAAPALVVRALGESFPCSHQPRP